jgi:hypothetical protein
MTIYLAAIDIASLIPLIVITLSMAIPIVAIIVDFFQKKEKMKLVEKAIEHGYDPENLMLEVGDSQPPMPYRAGMIVIAVGVGLFLVSLFGTLTIEVLDYLVLAGAFIVTLVGVALLANDRMNRDKFEQKKGGGSAGI